MIKIKLKRNHTGFFDLPRGDGLCSKELNVLFEDFPEENGSKIELQISSKKLKGGIKFKMCGSNVVILDKYCPIDKRHYIMESMRNRLRREGVKWDKPYYARFMI